MNPAGVFGIQNALAFIAEQLVQYNTLTMQHKTPNTQRSLTILE